MSTTITKRRVYKISECSKIFGVSRMTIHRRIKDGTLPVVRLGRSVFVIAEHVDRLTRVSAKAS